MNLVVHSSFFYGQQTEDDVASTESSRISRGPEESPTRNFPSPLFNTPEVVEKSPK